MKNFKWILIFFLFVSVCSGRCILHCKLNDNAADTTVIESIDSNNGTFSKNTEDGSVAGKVGTALYFDGDEHVAFGKGDGLKAIRKTCTQYSGNPILDGTNQAFTSVVYDDPNYYAFYGTSSTIYTVWSADGKTGWSSPTQCTGLSPGGVPSAWKEDDGWHMLYRAGAAGIYYATSTDRITWTDYAGNPVLTGDVGEWDEGTIDPWGHIKIGNTYQLYYNSVGGERSVGIARSTNLHDWTKDEENPIFDNYRFCSWPFKYKGYYYLAVPNYTGNAEHTDIQLYKCPDPNFRSWNREFVRIIVETNPVSGTWNDDDLDTPCLLTDDVNRDTFNASGGQAWMYYNGYDGSNWETGMVVETNFDDFVEPHHLSVAFWLKWDTVVNNRKFISWGENGTFRSWFIFEKTGGLLCFGSSNSYMATQVTDWSDDEWHFFVVTFDFENTHIYIDNVEQSLTQVGTVYPRISSSNEPLCFGGESDDGVMENYINGSIDNVMIFDHILTEQERIFFYNNGNGTESFDTYSRRGRDRRQ